MSEYPSIRDAILDNEHAANLYCAIKYLVWQTGYGLLAAFGIVIYLVATIVTTILPRSQASSIVDRCLSSTHTLTVAKACAAIILLTPIAGIVYMAITAFYAFLAFAGSIALGFITMGACFKWLFPWLDRVLPRVREESMQRPVARRVYGYCPVAFSIEPRWYEALRERFQ